MPSQLRLKQLILKHKQFLLYCVCGGIGVGTDTGLFLLTRHYGWEYQRANFLGYLSGTLISFILNRSVTFAAKDQVIKRLTSFLAVAGLGYLASALLLWIMVGNMHIDATIAKLITLPMVVLLQFSLNRRITFSANADESTAKIIHE